jgi:galactose-1-phosphate uridylyltransferase
VSYSEADRLRFIAWLKRKYGSLDALNTARKAGIRALTIDEDDELIAFKDIRPAAPVHLLIIPREHIATLADAEPRHQALLGRMALLATKLAREHGPPTALSKRKACSPAAATY